MGRILDDSVRLFRVESSFYPTELAQLINNDTKASPERYDDMVGRDIGVVMASVGWSFVDIPVVFCLSHAEIGPLALGFAAPIQLKTTTRKRILDRTAPLDAINLSYAVHSQYEGRSYGRLAADAAIVKAHSIWGHRLGKAKLNIQTRAGNTRSLALAQRFSIGHCAEADFVAQLTNSRTLAFSGFRGPWKDAFELSSLRLHAEHTRNSEQDKQELDPYMEPVP